MSGGNGSVQHCIISTDDCEGPETVYERLEQELNLPDDFGRNLDALWDSLSSDVDGPFEIVIEDPAALDDALGGGFSDFMEVMTALVLERDDVRIVIGNI